MIERVMDLSQLSRKLIAAARANPPADHVPFAFEKRIMARLAVVPAFDEWVWWSRALWRGAAACLALTVLLSAWSALPRNAGSMDLEDAVVVSVDQADVSW